MTMKQIMSVLHESQKLGTVQEIYFEGGEPFLFYPLMLEGIRKANEMGFKAGIYRMVIGQHVLTTRNCGLNPFQSLAFLT